MKQISDTEHQEMIMARIELSSLREGALTMARFVLSIPAVNEEAFHPARRVANDVVAAHNAHKNVVRMA